MLSFPDLREKSGTFAAAFRLAALSSAQVRKCQVNILQVEWRPFISRSVRPLRITHVARASPGRRKVESLSVLAALVVGQPILEPITIGFVGDKDMGSELQNRRAIEGSGRDIDQLS